MQFRHPLRPGMYYHIYNRGNNRENLFLEEGNYRYFLSLYSKHISPFVQTFAYSMLPNHFHFAARILDDISGVNLSRQFSNMFNAYARSFNNRYARVGNLFHRPFERKPVRDSNHLLHLILYIHRNPAHHEISDFSIWPHSSYRAILDGRSTIIDIPAVLALFGSKNEFLRMHSFSMLDAGQMTDQPA